jgi:hypothetical protein
MVRRTDRPLLQVCISFEATRSSLHHLIEAYALSETIARLNFPSAAINHPVVKLHAIDPPVPPFELSPKVGDGQNFTPRIILECTEP